GCACPLSRWKRVCPRAHREREKRRTPALFSWERERRPWGSAAPSAPGGAILGRAVGGPGDAEASAVLGQRRWHGRRLVVAVDQRDRSGRGLSEVDRPAVLEGRGGAERDGAEVVERQDATSPGGLGLDDPLGRGERGRVRHRLVVCRAGRIVTEGDQPT